MDGFICTDLPGRLRVRLRPYHLTVSDYEQFCCKLKHFEGIESCSFNGLTGGLLITYNTDDTLRCQIIAVLASYRPNGGGAKCVSLMRAEAPLPANPIWGHLAKKILPLPLRAFINALKAIPRMFTGLGSLLMGRLNVEVLDASALAVCFFRRDFRAAGTLLFFFALSHFLEMWTKNRSRAGLYHSLAGRVEKVWIKTDDGLEIQVNEEDLVEGSLVIVRSGGLIPVDGIVEEGEALVNQASMTGEALGVRKSAGGAVFSGTSVEEGEILIKAKKVGSATRVQSIISYIEQSEASKAGLQGRAERLADSIVPFSFILSGLVYLFTRDTLKAGNVLLVDYSCAIRLSTPISVLTAMREGNEIGVLVKGGRYLEELATADTAVFDKTGTITMARPKVKSVLPFNGFSRKDALRLAACLEEHFPHPVGLAVVKAAQAEGLHHEEEHAKVEYVVAHGICSTWQEQRVFLGSSHFIIEDVGIKLSEHELAQAEAEAAKGLSILYMAVGGRLAAVISIHDELRPEVKESIEQLRSMGIKRAIMLTGDLEATAATVARECGFDEYRSQMLPDQKAAFVENLVSQGHKVMMIGDGLNDSAALSRANVGISLGDSSALAKDVANVLVLNGSLGDLPAARQLAKLTMKRVKSNYWLIVGLNTLFIGLGMSGVTGPGLTALLHNATTAWVAWRGSRTYLSKKPKTINDKLLLETGGAHY